MLLLGEQLWNGYWLVGIVSLAAVYVYLVRRFARRETGRLQRISFLLGCLLLVVLLGSPFAVLSHLSFALHMTQMSLLYFFVPPLLMLGIPEKAPPLVAIFLKRLSLRTFSISPRVYLSSFAILFFAYHLPQILSFLVAHPFFRITYLALLFVLAFGIWRPLAFPDPLFRLCLCKMKRFAWWSGVAITPACLLFLLSALFEGQTNPMATQFVVHLCGPELARQLTDSIGIPAKLDRVLAALFMLVLHKASLVLIVWLQGRVSKKFYEEIGKCAQKNLPL